MALFGKNTVKLTATPKSPKPNKGIQGDREMRVKRNGKLVKRG